MAISLKSILGKLFVNDKQIVVLDDTAENGGIESGSNTNGEYTKFPDGTLICYKRDDTNHPNGALVGGIYKSESVDTVFPHLFVDGSTISASIAFTDFNENGFWMSCSASSLAGQQKWVSKAFRIQSFTTGTVGTYTLTAIGRWK